MTIAFYIIFGLIFGSFLSVCIYRIPLSRLESIAAENADLIEQPVNPVPGITFTEPRRSICFHCKKTLRWWHNIPVVSWILLRGKCAYCKHPISARYPVVELMAAFSSYLSFTWYGPTLTGLVVFFFCCALIVISFIDYDYYIIPNVISLPGVVVGFAIAVINQFFHLFSYPIVASISGSLYGLLLGGGFLFAVSELYLRVRRKEGLGMGDVKLLAMTGVLFGPEASLYTIFVGSLLGSVLGIGLVIFGGRKMSQQLPFGPYLALGTFIYLFWGRDTFSLGFERVAAILSWVV